MYTDYSEEQCLDALARLGDSPRGARIINKVFCERVFLDKYAYARNKSKAFQWVKTKTGVLAMADARGFARLRAALLAHPKYGPDALDAEVSAAKTGSGAPGAQAMQQTAGSSLAVQAAATNPRTLESSVSRI